MTFRDKGLGIMNKVMCKDYVKPKITVIHVDMEGCLMAASNDGDGIKMNYDENLFINDEEDFA